MIRGFCLSLIAAVLLCGLGAIFSGLWRARDGSANAPLFWTGLGLFLTGLFIGDFFLHPALVKDLGRLLMVIGTLSLAVALLAPDRLACWLAGRRHDRSLMPIKLER